MNLIVFCLRCKYTDCYNVNSNTINKLGVSLMQNNALLYGWFKQYVSVKC